MGAFKRFHVQLGHMSRRLMLRLLKYPGVKKTFNMPAVIHCDILRRLPYRPTGTRQPRWTLHILRMDISNEDERSSLRK